MGPTANHLTSHYFGSKKEDENTSSGFKSALNWCPYAEAAPHYSRNSGQQHLYAVVMKTPQRPREKATIKGEKVNATNNKKKLEKRKYKAWEIRNSSAELFQRHNFSFFETNV